MDKSNTQHANLGRRALVLGATAGLALPAIGLAGCATRSQPSGPVREFAEPQVRVGDRWLYREINRYNQLPLSTAEVTVTAASPLTCSVRRTRIDSTAGEIIRRDAFQEERYAQPWAVEQEPTYDMIMDFAQPMPLLPSPLQVGQTERSRTNYTVAGYWGHYDWLQYLKATAVERIATPAGVYDCLRVRRTIWFEYPDVFRFGSSRIDNIWYAPEVNRWVRREWTGEYQHENSLGKMGGIRRREDWVRWELLAYEPAAPSAG